MENNVPIVCDILVFVVFILFFFMFSAFRISLIQMKVGKNKLENVGHAINCIRKTVESDRPKLVALPECFNSPYGEYFVKVEYWNQRIDEST